MPVKYYVKIVMSPQEHKKYKKLAQRITKEKDPNFSKFVRQTLSKLEQ